MTAKAPIIRCPACGAEVPRSARFCERCGAALGDPAHAPPGEAAVDAPIPQQDQQPRRRGARRKYGCCLGCLLTVLLMCSGVAVLLGLPTLWFGGRPGDRLRSEAVDPVAEAGLKAVFEEAGLTEDVVDLRILPVVDRDGLVAVLTADPAALEEARRDAGTLELPSETRIAALAGAIDDIRAAGITYVSLVLVDGEGDATVTFAAPATAVDEVAQVVSADGESDGPAAKVRPLRAIAALVEGRSDLAVMAMAAVASQVAAHGPLDGVRRSITGRTGDYVLDAALDAERVLKDR